MKMPSMKILHLVISLSLISFLDLGCGKPAMTISVQKRMKDIQQEISALAWDHPA